MVSNRELAEALFNLADEFTILLPDTDRDAGVAIAESSRNAVAERDWSIGAHRRVIIRA